MRVLSVSWNEQLDKTKIKLTDEFANADWLIKADVLSDVIDELTELYNLSLPSYNKRLLNECGIYEKSINNCLTTDEDQV